MKNNRKIVIAVSIIAVLLTGAAVTVLLGRLAEQNQINQPSASEKQLSPEQNAESKTAAITIVYTDDGFNPSTYMVAAGDAVAVVNNSSRTLEFASNDHPSHLTQPELNMEPMQPGQSGMFVVTKAGTWGFHDHWRAGFGGTLTVENKK